MIVASGAAVVLQGCVATNNKALGGSGGGKGSGGGLYIDATASAFLDAFTLANVLNNNADIGPNIDGPYTI